MCVIYVTPCTDIDICDVRNILTLRCVIMCVIYVTPCTHIDICDAVCDVPHAQSEVAVHQFSYAVDGRTGRLQQRDDDGRV